MHIHQLLLIACMTATLSTLTAFGQQTYKSTVWCPDNDDGTFTNPVINADYSDPDVIRVGDDYWLTASSFNCIPGLPILHSHDLVNWQIVGHALRSLYDNDSVRPGCRVWAPSIRYHAGTYYIYWGDPDRGVFMVKTTDPRGTWDDPVLVVAQRGIIDTTPLWDDDGRCYLVNAYANSRAGFASMLVVRELSADGTHAIGQPVMVYDGWAHGDYVSEGPKFYKRDGYYYILFPAGGVATGWQVAARSKNIYGPYESRTICVQGSAPFNAPHQGGWVTTQTGEDWFMNFQDKGAYGRVVHLNPIHWRDGWPVMGESLDKKAVAGTPYQNKDLRYAGQPVVRYRKPNVGRTWPVENPVESDEFNTAVLGQQWQWMANHHETFGMPTSNGYFRLLNHRLPLGTLMEVPNLLLQKTPADAFTVTAKVRVCAKKAGQYGGLVMMGLDYSALVARLMDDGQFQLLVNTCHKADKGGAEASDVIATLRPTAKDAFNYRPGAYLDLCLRLIVTKGAKMQFYYSANGKQWTAAGTPFAMREGKWIGAKFGFVSVDTNAKSDLGWVDIDWVRVTK